MRGLVKLAATAVAVSLVAAPAFAAQIRYTLSATVSGSFSGSPIGAGTISDVAAILNVYGDASTLATTPGGAFDVVRLTYSQGQVGPFTGALDNYYWGPLPNVFAISNPPAISTTNGFAALTELTAEGTLQPGGFFYGPGLLGYDGVSDLAPVPVTMTEPIAPGVDLAFQDGTLFDWTALSDVMFSATLISGETPDEALAPTTFNPEGFGFEFDATAGEFVYVDPTFAAGYDFILGSSSPLITQAIFPLLPASNYRVYALNDLGTELPLTFTPTADGLLVDFTSLPGFLGGINGFRLLGIDLSEGIDVTNALGFVTGFAFAEDGPVSLSQNPIAHPVPEPSTWAMMLMGFAGLGGLLRARRRAIWALA